MPLIIQVNYRTVIVLYLIEFDFVDELLLGIEY